MSSSSSVVVVVVMGGVEVTHAGGSGKTDPVGDVGGSGGIGSSGDAFNDGGVERGKELVTIVVVVVVIFPFPFDNVAATIIPFDVRRCKRFLCVLQRFEHVVISFHDRSHFFRHVKSR